MTARRPASLAAALLAIAAFTGCAHQATRVQQFGPPELSLIPFESTT